jgi:hypothetical protein
MLGTPEDGILMRVIRSEVTLASLRCAVMLCSLATAGCAASLGLDDYRFEDCPAVICDVAIQCGCGDSQACDISATGVADCRPEGGKDIGESCAAASECAAGLTCLEAESAALCVRFCEEESDCSGVGARCVLTLAGASDVRLCTLACDLATGGGCTAGFGCQLFVAGEAGGFATHCIAVGPRAAGDACTTNAECALGLACVPEAGGSGGRCRRYCEVDSPTCGVGESCDASAFPGAALGGVRFGACR